MFADEVGGAGVGGVDEGFDFGVDLRGGVFAHGEHLGAAAEVGALVGGVGDFADVVAHAPFGDHAAGDAGGLLEVVLCAGGDFVEDDVFGGASGEGDGDHVL